MYLLYSHYLPAVCHLYSAASMVTMFGVLIVIYGVKESTTSNVKRKA